MRPVSTMLGGYTLAQNFAGQTENGQLRRIGGLGNFATRTNTLTQTHVRCCASARVPGRACVPKTDVLHSIPAASLKTHKLVKIALLGEHSPTLTSLSFPLD